MAPVTSPTQQKTLRRATVIRDPGFAERFELACSGEPQCPPLNSGRLRWISDEFSARFGQSVSTETVRKWAMGKMKPRGDKIEYLAEILNVDSAWLYLGAEQPDEVRARNATASGAANILAGLIQLDGGVAAFPEDADRQSSPDNVDLQAIIKGASYSFSVCLGEPVGDAVRFQVPVKHDRVIVLGLVRSGFAFTVVEISRDTIAARGSRRGLHIEVVLSESEVAVAKIENFSRRL